MRRIPELDMQLEIPKFGIRRNIRSAVRTTQDPFLRHPLIGSAQSMPALQRDPIKQLLNRTPHRLLGTPQQRSPMPHPRVLLSIRRHHRTRQAIALHPALHRQVPVFPLPLRRNGKAKRRTIVIYLRDRSRTPPTADKPSHHRPRPRSLHLQPGRHIPVRQMDRKVPASHKRNNGIRSKAPHNRCRRK